MKLKCVNVNSLVFLITAPFHWATIVNSHKERKKKETVCQILCAMCLPNEWLSCAAELSAGLYFVNVSIVFALYKH